MDGPAWSGQQQPNLVKLTAYDGMRSRMCDWGPEITRTRVMGGVGKKDLPDELFFLVADITIGQRVSVGEAIVSNPLKRPEHYRDLAEKYHCLATITLSKQMKDRYLLMAKDYVLLADIAEQEILAPAWQN